MGIYVLIGGVVFFAGLITLVDWLGNPYQPT